MSTCKKGMAVLLIIIVMFQFVLFPDSKNVYASNNIVVLRAEGETNGYLKVYADVGKGPEEIGLLGFGRCIGDLSVNLKDCIDYKDNIRIYINKSGGGAAYLDYVSIGGITPLNDFGDKTETEKLSVKDNDLISIPGGGLELLLDRLPGNGIMKISARIEPVEISKEPFQFPLSNMYKDINSHSEFYHYELNTSVGAVSIDGNIDEADLMKPFVKEYAATGSGHPEGYIYIWVLNDNKNLYVLFDATPDNTMDGDEDYAKVYINTPEGVREFKSSMEETQWGTPGFIYTGRVNYQHKVYEFKIPFAQIGIDEPDASGNIDIAFGAYGTMAPLDQASFTSMDSCYIGGQPYAAVVDDFDRDGNLDIVSTRSVQNAIGVILGKGNGTFQDCLYYDVGYSSIWVTSGMFNPDSYPDLAVTISNACVIMINNGDGSFTKGNSYNTGTSPNTVLSGDFNKDGNADLAVSNRSSNNVSILLGNGDGSFTFSGDYAVESSPGRMALGDFNGDNNSDIAVVSKDYGFKGVSILMGLADGTFNVAETHPAGSYPLGIVSDDFNDDGKSDLAVTNFSSSFDELNIVYGLNRENDISSFSEFSYEVLYGACGIAGGDYNCDDKPDIAVANRYSNKVSILKGSYGMFHFRQDFSVGESPVNLVSGDFNNDGKDDLAVVNNGDGSISILINGEQDTTPPQWPAESVVNADEIGVNAITLSWTEAADNVGVIGYEIHVDSNCEYTVTDSVYEVTGLLAETEYSFKIEAVDAAGNRTDNGPGIIVSTLNESTPDGAAKLERISVPQIPELGEEGDLDSYGAAVSSDGRYVAFSSSSGNLVENDTNGMGDVFLYDRDEKEIMRVSVSSDGTEASFGISDSPSISGDGRYIAFGSSAFNLVSGDVNGNYDIFVYDAQTGETKLASMTSDGIQGNGSSNNGVISTDGRYVVFCSTSTNFVSEDTDNISDIYIKDMGTGTLELVSKNSGQACFLPDVSGDGRYVVYNSRDGSIVDGDTNNLDDIFLYDRQTEQTTRISVDSDGDQAVGGDSSYGRITADGEYVVFRSLAVNLVENDNNEKSDIFAHDVENGITERVSLTSNGEECSGNCTLPDISDDGRYITFVSNADNFCENDSNSSDDVFLHDILTGETTCLSLNKDGAAGNGDSSGSCISDDGRYIVFNSVAGDLIDNDTNGAFDIFLYSNFNISGEEDNSPPQWNDDSIVYAFPVTSSGAVITWSDAMDESLIKKYRIYVNGVFITAVDGETNTYELTELSSSTEYSCQIQAVDEFDNESDDGPAVIFTTPGISQSAPVADAGGPYAINWGDSLLLDGSASYDPNAAEGDSIVSYKWDINNNGMYNDASGATVSLTWEQLQSIYGAAGITLQSADPGTNVPFYQVNLMVTDATNRSSTAVTSLHIYDPTVLPLTISQSENVIHSGDTLQFTASEAVEWSVRQVPGVDVGSIDANGLYTAPDRVPPSGKVCIYAESLSDHERVMALVEVCPEASDSVFVEGMSLPVPSGVNTSHGTYKLEDIGGDGITDLWISGDHRSVDGLSYYTGQGDGTFELSMQLEKYMLSSDVSYPEKSWIEELTGDEYPDMVVMRDNDNDDGFDEIRVYEGDGTGRFTRLWSNRDGIATPATGGVPSPVLLFEDVDNDEDMDIIQTGLDSPIVVRLNDGAGRFTGGGSYSKEGRSACLYAGDQNSDGYIDLVVFNRESGWPAVTGSGIKVFLNDGYGGFEGQPLFKPWGDTYYSTGMLLFGDVTSDGVGDMIVSRYAGPELYLLKGLDDGTFGEPEALGITGDPKTFIHADDDGCLDLLITTVAAQPEGNNYSIELWNGDGNGGFNYSGDIWQSGRYIHEVKVTELNGDSRYDLAVKISPKAGADGYVTGTLLGGADNAVAPALKLYPDPKRIVNMGDRYEIMYFAEQTGLIETDIQWYVNDIPGGNEDIGTIVQADDYKAKYLPPEENDLLSDVTIKVANTDGTQALTSEVAFTRYEWHKVSDHTLDNLRIKKLKWASDGSRLYAATETGVLWSGNGGVTWVAASGSGENALPQSTIKSLAVDQDDPLTVYVGVMRFIEGEYGYGGVYKTVDGGITWNPANNGLPTTNVGATPNQPYFSIWDDTLVFGERVGEARTLYASVRMGGINTDGLYRSDDGGANWRKAAISDGNDLINYIAAASNSPVVYAIRRGDEAIELFKSSNGGLDWSSIQTNIAANLPDYTFIPGCVVVDPHDDEHVIVVGNVKIYGITPSDTYVFDSRDGGVTWTETGSDFGISGTPVFSPATAGTVITTSGFLSTEPEDVHWHRIKAGLKEGTTVLSFETIDIAPAGAPSSGTFYAATCVGVFASEPLDGAASSLTISQSENVVHSGDTLQFTASKAVEWSVRQVPGVDVGSIDANGLYTAPDRVPPSGKVCIYAESLSDHERVMALVEVCPEASDSVFVEGMSLPVPSGVNTSHGTYKLEDIGGDGITDLWISGDHRSVDGLSYYTGQGDGTFELSMQLEKYMLSSDVSYPEKSWIEELTGDEYPDMVVMRDNDNDDGFDEIRVYEGDGTGRFTRLWSNRDGIATPATGGVPSPVLLFEDVDNDEDMDIIQTGLDSPIVVRLNDGAGRFTGGGSYSKEGRSACLYAGDQNSDGYIDLVVFNRESGWPAVTGSGIKVFLNDGYGGFEGQPLFKPWGDTYYSTGMLLFGDVTSDGVGDMIVSRYAGPELYLLKGLDDGTFGEPEALGITGDPKTFIHADDDGCLDLLITTVAAQPEGNNYSIELWNGDGNGGFNYSGDIWQSGRYIHEVKVTELNGDSRYDLAVKISPKAGADGYVTGTLLGGADNAVAPALKLYPDPKRIVNMGDRYEIMYFAEQTGLIETDIQWYVNDIPGGNEDIGTIVQADDYKAKYLPPEENDLLSDVTIKVANTDGTQALTSEVAFTRYEWHKVSDHTLDNLRIKKLKWASDGSRLYAATETGVLWSGNGGVTWVAASGSGENALPQSTIKSLAVDQDDPLTVYVGVMRFIEGEYGYGGVYKTVDGGITWNPANNGLPTTNVGATPNQPYFSIWDDTLVFGERVGEARTLYASVRMGGINTDGLYRSDDGGANWRKAAISDGNDLINYIAAASNSPVVYAIRRGDEAIELFKSSNGGLDWSSIQTNIAANLPDYTFIPGCVVVDPHDDEHVIVVGNVKIYGITPSDTYVFDSRDGGVTWTETGSDFGISGTPVFSPATAGTVITTSGFLSTEPEDVHWHRIKAGLKEGTTVLSFETIDIAPAGAPSSGTFYAATRAGVFATVLPGELPPPTDDFEAPTWSQDDVLTAANITSSSLALTWAPAEDDVNITGYRIYMNGKLYVTLGDVLTTNIVGLSPGTQYTFMVRAGDGAGNWTPDGPNTTVTTASNTSGSSYEDEDKDEDTQDTNSVTVESSNGKIVSIPASVSTVLDKDKGLITNVVIDEDRALDAVNNSEAGSIIAVQVMQSEKLNVEMSGKLMNKMADRGISLGIQSPYASYTLPASELNIEAIMEKTGIEAKDAKLNVTIAQADEEEIKEALKYANSAGLKIVGTPVKFKIEIMAGDKTYEVTRFGSYVERTIKLPGPVNPNFAVGVEVTGNGSFTPVPTRFKQSNGQTSAVIMRNTNSTYTVIENRKTFIDTADHWAEENINILASKLIVNGTPRNTFAPDDYITRAELVSVTVRALGLAEMPEKALFNDVSTDDWYAGNIGAAINVGIIRGYNDGSFKPNAYVSRQETAVIIKNALEFAGVDMSIDSADIQQYLSRFGDYNDIGLWARPSIALMVKHSIIEGYVDGTLRPSGKITRAEAVVMIIRMMIKLEFI